MKVDLKNFPFLVIDVASFYLALLVSLVIRLGPNFTFEIFSNHVGPFSLVLVGWILVFFVAGFYDIRNFSKRLDYLKIFIVAILISAALSATYFYISSPTGESISPKTILILFVVSFAIIDYLAREVLFKHYLQSKSLQNVLLIGKGKDVEELVNYLIEHPQLGYKVRLWIKEYRREDFDKLIRENGLDVLVIPASLSQNKEIASKIYREMLSGVEVIGFSEFYENIFGKVSIDELEENWFLERLKPKNDFYLLLKRIVDMILAIFILIITLLLWILIVFGIKMSSRGPTMFLGKRAGFKEQEFTPYKFRTMDVGTGDTIIESRGDEFGVVEKDPRVFGFGKFLRKVRLDELPQVINVIKGELVFVGPRADLADFYKFLKGKIPYYQIRTIVRPGLTGWAQVHNSYGSTVEGTKERLAYDIYYIKNRSFALDLIIVLRTLKTILMFSGV